MSKLRYSIKDLENFTKIKAHTIRIWEQRYGLLTPSRTDTNIRYYSEDDLKKILNINLLYNSGLKISKIACLSDEQIINEAKSRILVTEVDKQSDLDEVTLLILDYKVDKIKAILEEQFKKNDLNKMYDSFVIPLLQKIGQLWQVNSMGVVHEHYFSVIFREFLISKIYAIETDPDPLKTAMLFLHDYEEHEFSLLMHHYILKKNGYLCHNFGQKVPVKEVEKAFGHIKPQIVVSTFTAKISEKNFIKVEKTLKLMSKNSQVIISGSQLNYLDLQISKDLLVVKSIGQLETLLNG